MNCGLRIADCGLCKHASRRARPPISNPQSKIRNPQSHDPHHLPRGASHLSRARGRFPAPRRRRHVRGRAEAAVGAAHPRRRTQPHSTRAELRYKPEDIRWVINTHLHFDHAGGNTYREPVERAPDGPTVRPSDRPTLVSFPRATYVVQQGELEFARHTNERTAASYLPHNFEPVSFRTIDGAAELLPGVRCLPTPGHVPFHQSVLVESAGEHVCFLADVVPTSAHLPLPWIMGYDLQPLVTLESKRQLYRRAEAEGWLLFFEHDPVVVAGRLGREGKGFGLVEALRAG